MEIRQFFTDYMMSKMFTRFFTDYRAILMQWKYGTFYKLGAFAKLQLFFYVPILANIS